jgi:tetraacyldisaccharide 4'-kinase
LLYRCGAFRTFRLPVPVVSIGNITCGGTGKTPMVEWTARFLGECGKKVVILSRGYRGEKGSSDESQALREGLGSVPHLLGADRVKTGNRAINELGAQCLVLDDAFQHVRLHRDLDLVTIDSLNPFGYGYVLPRGLLREPIPALGRADAVVLTRVDQCDRAVVDALRERIRRFKPLMLLAEAVHRPTGLARWADGERLEIGALAGKKVLAFCGIGNPRSFALTLQSLGANVADHAVFPDHCRYDDRDVSHVRSEARRLGVEAVLTTRKDAVKLDRQADFGAPLWVLDVVLEVTQGKEALQQKIREVCSA